MAAGAAGERAPRSFYAAANASVHAPPARMAPRNPAAHWHSNSPHHGLPPRQTPRKPPPCPQKRAGAPGERAVGLASRVLLVQHPEPLRREVRARLQRAPLARRVLRYVRVNGGAVCVRRPREALAEVLQDPVQRVEVQ